MTEARVYERPARGERKRGISGGGERSVEVGFRSEGGENVIWVADDGVGVASDEVPFVFKRFYRGREHHAKKVKGTGLGLSIVKRAVEADGGEISLNSTPGVRTEFAIRVPRE